MTFFGREKGVAEGGPSFIHCPWLLQKWCRLVALIERDYLSLNCGEPIHQNTLCSHASRNAGRWSILSYRSGQIISYTVIFLTLLSSFLKSWLIFVKVFLYMS